MSRACARTVYLVGAGPGDPELLTLKACALLRTADLVLHDDLVPVPILELAGRHTRVTSVGKRCGRKRITQSEINDRMIDAARNGLSVVRLKSGDPLIFGRLGEELDALRTAGVAFEVVPGISAGFAAAASLGISLTDRRSSSRVLILSAHHSLERRRNGLELNPDALSDTSLIIYMPGMDLSGLRQQLLDAGLDPALQCVLVSRATTVEQREVRSSLGDLHLLTALEAPSLLLVGPSIAYGALGGFTASVFSDSMITGEM